MKRVIVHSDINHCYAQLEEMKNPELRNVPMAVGGSTEKRNGIILAKNDLAKAAGVKTGEALWQAKRKCRDLIIIHPNYEEYMYYTEKVKDVYRQYTDRVESFGLDEAWIDLSDSQLLFGDGIELAKKIQDEVFEKTGLTVSMGVSFNKIFAKLASDLLKHKGFVVVTPENFREMLWDLPVEDLLMVGRRTCRKLNEMGVFTIGELAAYDIRQLQRRFGIMGPELWRYANGLDDSQVHHTGYVRPVKSVGNSKTCVKDICSIPQLREVFRVLSESVAYRLRELNMQGRVVSISLRSVELRYCSAQMKLNRPTDLAREILEAAMNLVRRLQPEEINFRSVGIHVSQLTPYTGSEQLDLFSTPQERPRQRNMEQAFCSIREKYGYDAVRMCSAREDRALVDFDPTGLLHQVHPVGFLDGPIGRR